MSDSLDTDDIISTEIEGLKVKVTKTDYIQMSTLLASCGEYWIQ